MKKSSTTAGGIKVSSRPLLTKSAKLSGGIHAPAERTDKGTEFSVAPVGKRSDRSDESGKKLMLDPRKTSSKQVSSVSEEQGPARISFTEESGKKNPVFKPIKTPSKQQHPSLSEEHVPEFSSGRRFF